MDENKKNNKAFIIAIVILSTLVIVLGCYIYYDKVISNNGKQTESNNSVEDNKEDINKEDTNKEDTNASDNRKNINFDFSELSNILHSSIQKDNITTFVSKCVVKDNTIDGLPETEHINTSVSNNTIDTIIDKLKTAKSIDIVTYSWFGCPPKSITYYVSVNSTELSEFHSKKVLSINYANSGDILLVGYNKNGYAFYFNSSEEIIGFIESLK